MKKTLIIAAAIIAGIGAFIFMSPKSDGTTAATPKLTFASVQSDVTNDDAVLYDVRTPEEFASGHFAGAANFSLQTMQAGTLPDVTKDTKIYLYCHSGNRAGQAATILKEAGYTEVTNLGGLDDMQALGGKLITN